MQCVCASCWPGRSPSNAIVAEVSQASALQRQQQAGRFKTDGVAANLNFSVARVEKDGQTLLRKSQLKIENGTMTCALLIQQKATKAAVGTPTFRHTQVIHKA